MGCRQFRPCRQPDFPYATCRTPLVFNRNSGTCDFVDFAPCSTFDECPSIGNGRFPSNRCYAFIFCFEGVKHGEFECPMGWMFNESVTDCVEDIHGVCTRSNIKEINTIKPFGR